MRLWLPSPRSEGVLFQQTFHNLLYVGNGSGTYVHDLSSGASPTAGAVNIFAYRLTAGSALDVWCNGGAAATQAPVGALSAADAGYVLADGYAGFGMDGQRMDTIHLAGSLTDAEITAIGKALAAKWGGTWA